MKKVLRPFDYLFYRLAEWFFHKDGVEGMRAIGILTAMQGLYITFALLMLHRRIFGMEYVTHTKGLAYTPVPFSLLVLHLNYRRYSYKIPEVGAPWRGKESKSERVAGAALIFLALASSFLVFGFALV